MAGIMRGTRRCLVVALAAVVVTSGFVSTAAAGKKGPLPLVTKKEAQKAIDRAVELDIESGVTNDVTVLEEFAVGLYSDTSRSVLEQSLAADAGPAFDEYEVKVVKAFTVRSTSYPQYFLAQVETTLEGGIVDRSVDLFVRESKKGDWLWERSIADPKAGWPKFQVDKDGYVPAEVNTKKLSIDPEAVPAELATYLSGAEPPANESLFDESIGTDGYRADVAEFAFSGWPEGLTPTFVGAPSEHEVLTFPLKDGSALVTFGLQTTFHLTAGNDLPDTVLDWSTPDASIDPRIAPGLYWDIVLEGLEAFSVVVPTKNSGDGLTAIPVLYGPLAARGTAVSDPSQYQ
jgi:hypothetical protein